MQKSNTVQYELRQSNFIDFSQAQEKREVVKNLFKVKISKVPQSIEEFECIKEYLDEIDQITAKTPEKQYVKDELAKYKLNTALSSFKPLCLYAMSLETDHNGAIHSRNNISTFDDFISHELKQHFDIHKIAFDGKKNLKQQIADIQKDRNVALLILDSHGSHSSVGGLSTGFFSSSAYLNLAQNSQIILYACETAGGQVHKSIAYKIAKDNSCEVFAATESISLMKPTMEIVDSKPRVKHVDFATSKAPVSSYRIFIEEQRKESQQSFKQGAA